MALAAVPKCRGGREHRPPLEAAAGEKAPRAHSRGREATTAVPAQTLLGGRVEVAVESPNTLDYRTRHIGNSYGSSYFICAHLF
jgi:hypothetical protein